MRSWILTSKRSKLSSTLVQETSIKSNWVLSYFLLRTKSTVRHRLPFIWYRRVKKSYKPEIAEGQFPLLPIVMVTIFVRNSLLRLPETYEVQRNCRPGIWKGVWFLFRISNQHVYTMSTEFGIGHSRGLVSVEATFSGFWQNRIIHQIATQIGNFSIKFHNFVIWLSILYFLYPLSIYF